MSTPVHVDHIDHCPACDHDRLLVPNLMDDQADNSLGSRVKAGSGTTLEGFDIRHLLRSDWRVCSHCGLIFSRMRPRVDETNDWYVPLFRLVENRNFDVHPLPDLYLKNQDQSAHEMFDTLKAHGALDGVESVLHLRCNAGHLHDLLVRQCGVKRVAAMEYFEEPARYAAGLLGDDAVSRITSPAPELPEDEAGFDLILVNHFLTHSPDPRQFVEQVKARLAQGGRIVFYNEQDHDRVLRHSDYYSKGINVFHNQLFTRETLLAFLWSCGLSPKEVPPPKGLKWSIGHHTMMVVCQIGTPVPMPKGHPDESFALVNTWADMHRRYRGGKSWPKPLRKTLAKSLELRYRLRRSPAASAGVVDPVQAPQDDQHANSRNAR